MILFLIVVDPLKNEVPSDGKVENVKNGQLINMTELNDSYEDIVANDIYKWVFIFYKFCKKISPVL